MPRDGASRSANQHPGLVRDRTTEAKGRTSCNEEVRGRSQAFISTSEQLKCNKGAMNPCHDSQHPTLILPRGDSSFPHVLSPRRGRNTRQDWSSRCNPRCLPSSTSHPRVSFPRLCSFGPTETASKEVVWPTYGGSGYLVPPKMTGKEDFGETRSLARVEGGRH